MTHVPAIAYEIVQRERATHDRNATAVYRHVAETWKTIHSHWPVTHRRRFDRAD